jgi:DNA-binding XRE family transcriptional regulator
METKKEARRKAQRRASSIVDTSQRPKLYYQNFGNELRQRRLLNNLSQAELAKQAGIDRSYLAQIELGKRRLSLEVANRLAEALQCTLSDLVRQ